MEEIRIDMMGRFALSRGGKPVRDGIGRKPRALLAHLLIMGGTQRRDRLASLLWPDRFDSQARQSLRQAVSDLRKALGDDGRVLQTVDESIAIDQSAIVCDILEFETAARETSLDSLRHAAALYGGDLLEDLDGVSEPFDAWLAQNRARLRALAADVHAKLLEAGEPEIPPEEQIALAERLVALDPAREDGHRALMRLYAEAGRRSAALAQFEACREALAREGGAESDAATVALHDMLRGSEDAALLPASRPTANESRRSPPFGRHKRRLVLALISIVGLAAAIGTALLWLDPRPVENDGTLSEASARPSVAVEPFETVSDKSVERAYAIGVTEGIGTALANMVDMIAISPPAGVAADSGAGHLDEGLQDLADYLLTGTVQQADGHIRVTARLVRSSDRQFAWAGAFDRPAHDVFAVQDAIVHEILAALQVTLTEGEQARLRTGRQRPDLRAWLTANRALAHLRALTPTDNRRARQLYKEAIEADPDYRGANLGLAWTHFAAARFGWSDDRQADIAAANAIAFRTYEDAEQDGMLLILRAVLTVMEGDHKTAVALADQSIKTMPGAADVAALRSLVLSYAEPGHRPGVTDGNVLLQTPGQPAWRRWNAARLHRLAGEPQLAIEKLEASTGPQTNSIVPLVELAAAYVQAGRLSDARATADRIEAMRPNFSAREWLSLPPYADPKLYETELKLLRMAGLPE